MRGIAARYAFDRDRADFLRTAMVQHGDVFPLDRRHLVVTDPELTHDVLVRTGGDFATGHNVLRGFAVEPPELAALWLRGRRIAAHGMGPRMLAAHAERLERSTAAALAGIADRDLDIVPAMQQLMSAAGVDFCLGGATGPPGDADHAGSAGYAEILAATGNASITQLLVQDRVSPQLSRLPWRAVRQARAHDAELRAAIDRCVAHRLAGPRPAEPADLLDVLIADGGLTPEHLARTVKRTVAGTHAIPGLALAWLIREVGGRPELEERLHAEAVAGSRSLAGTVVRETLRRWPPIWLATREARCATAVGDHRLDAGHQVMLVPYLVHRDERWWNEPEEFRPQRWAAGEPPPTRHAYLPFGAGPRVCLGYQLGMTQLVIAVAAIVARYTIDLIEPGTPSFESVLRPAGLRARLVPRRDGSPY